MVHNVPVLSNCQVHCCSCSNRSCDLRWRLLCHHKCVQPSVFPLLFLDGTHSSVRRCAFHAARGSGWTVTEGLWGWIETKHHLEKQSPERVLSWTVYLDISLEFPVPRWQTWCKKHCLTFWNTDLKEGKFSVTFSKHKLSNFLPLSPSLFSSIGGYLSVPRG